MYEGPLTERVNPRELEDGREYVLSVTIPLLPKKDMSRVGAKDGKQPKIFTMLPRSVFTVIERDETNACIWYRIEVDKVDTARSTSNKNSKPAKGWITSMALGNTTGVFDVAECTETLVEQVPAEVRGLTDDEARERSQKKSTKDAEEAKALRAPAVDDEVSFPGEDDKVIEGKITEIKDDGELIVESDGELYSVDTDILIRSEGDEFEAPVCRAQTQEDVDKRLGKKPEEVNGPIQTAADIKSRKAKEAEAEKVEDPNVRLLTKNDVAKKLAG